MKGQIRLICQIKDFRKMSENTNYSGMWVLVDWIDNTLVNRIPFDFEGEITDDTWLKIEINKGRVDYFIANDILDVSEGLVRLNWIEAGSERLKYWPTHELFELIHGFQFHEKFMGKVEYL
ncbi:MAG: hypothetical protein ACLFUI_08530 [Halanaerobiales bacterium]